ncbi:MAG: fumarate hydratase [Gammaproteobacteria bacterium (ex Lamellibrachia satsuma)]|nr:fumarate hydratase [gamma proteobacterium endosymbiont of Lamellibrachia anaximandri]QYZ65555.1 MAG: fumarate hydratase [Gammaproteobacteria bacterium (ex Lamellibrachia satsuma)]RLJ16776.1 MAG: fumarate hydratase [bacterium endosymbiont of Escarpia laminata]RRS32964.1 MAG: fumarate hydratase [Gammaproteobacteria bacterium (ex Lamellibrachia satsuma)]RRS37638.1 MAG: fumarate hydratase [Gammaproteobacteria bacterium (ex Lamellibrachia satsuma)]
MAKKKSKKRSSWIDLNPVSLEADVAYFEARLELVGTPATHYQAAQLKAYKALEVALSETLGRLRGSEK